MAVTQYLSEQLARASSIQASLQQKRVDMQRQRYEKLSDNTPQSISTQTGSALPAEALQGSIGAMGQQGVDVVDQLSTEQRQVFEEEASALVQSLQADLAAVQHAEQQLQDIWRNRMNTSIHFSPTLAHTESRSRGAISSCAEQKSAIDRQIVYCRCSLFLVGYFSYLCTVRHRRTRKHDM